MARTSSTGGAGLAPTSNGTKIPKPPSMRPTGGVGIAPVVAKGQPLPTGATMAKGQPLPASATVQPGTASPYVPAHSVTTTVTPPPPDLSGNKWEGYLTPDQLQNLYTASDQYASGVAQYGPGGSFLQNAQADYNQATQQAQYEHEVQQSEHAQQLAARGMLQSGIAASDFADLDRSLAVRQAGAQSSLNASVLGAQNAIDSLTRVWGHAQLVGQGEAPINAAGMAQFQPYQQTTQVPASGTLTPEQIKYINAGTHPYTPPPPGPGPATRPTEPPPGHGRVTDPFAPKRPVLPSRRSTGGAGMAPPRRSTGGGGLAPQKRGR